MNQQKAEFFDNQVDAQWAADEYGAEEAPKLERLRAAADIKPGMHILEPGCGTGRLTSHLAEWTGRTGKVVAMDISRAMAEACARRIENLPQARPITWPWKNWRPGRSRFNGSSATRSSLTSTTRQKPWS